MAYFTASSAVIISSYVRAGGTLVEVDPGQFVDLTRRFREKDALVIHGVMGYFRKKHVYIMGINGVTFLCETPEKLPVKVDVEAEKLHVLKY